MAAADIVVAVIIGLSLVFGVFRGFVKEVLSLVFWVGAIVLAGLFSAKLGALLSGIIVTVWIQKLVGFVLIFLLVVIIGGLLSNVLSELLSKAGLGGVNRSLGGLFGIIRGIVIITVLLMMFSRFEFARKFYQDSVSIPYIMVVVDKFEKWFGMTPDDKQTVRDAVNSA